MSEQNNYVAAKGRRVVTGHDVDGRAIFTIDETITPEVVASGDAAMATIWTAAEVPADLNDPVDGRTRDAGLTLKGGSVIRICDILPGGVSPFHRTDSIDYGIVLSGEIELELDDGLVKRLGAGDVIVQRGTIHLWRNPSATEACRIIFVLTEAKPYHHNGVPLPAVHA